MSLQDDYWDLRMSLQGRNLKRLDNIWTAFVAQEALLEEVRPILQAVKALAPLWREPSQPQSHAIPQDPHAYSPHRPRNDRLNDPASSGDHQPG